MWQQIAPAFRMMLVLTVLTGLLYPGVVTGLCQVFFRDQANGSLVVADGRVVGSSLIGQNFKKPEYFQPRPSAAGNDGYDPTASGAANYGPINQKLADRVKDSVAAFRKANPDYTGPIPADLVTASASGLDPHVSPASADAQAARIAKARGITVKQVRDLVERHTESRDLGFLGEPRVNVLAINVALDRRFPNK
ncbi:MAG: potassium-transporting ATPase subunit KdpC [Bryobacteraceae bacterium]|jgi:K+-transporting ATPase ATPase C chain